MGAGMIVCAEGVCGGGAMLLLLGDAILSDSQGLEVWISESEAEEGVFIVCFRCKMSGYRQLFAIASAAGEFGLLLESR